MTSAIEKNSVFIPPKNVFALTAFVLGITGIALIFIGNTFDSDSIWRTISHALGGAIISLGLVEVLHEFFVAKQVRAEFQILGDFLDKGIKRMCTSEEADRLSPELLRSSKVFKVLGIGNKWLVDGPCREILIKRIKEGREAQILIPDPTSQEIAERYLNDEPDTFELGLSGLAERAINWHKLVTEYGSNLEVRLYDDYPVVNMSIYDNCVFVSPVLYKRRGKDCLTTVFRSPSIGSAYYVEHFDGLFNKGNEITPQKIDELYNLIKVIQSKDSEYWKQQLKKYKGSKAWINENKSKRIKGFGAFRI